MDTLDLILWSQKRQRQAAAKGKGGSSWSSYWATHYISGLSIVSSGTTSLVITPAIVGTGQAGVSYEYSTDGVTYTEHGTSTGASYTATGLTANTFYNWRARPYLGTEYGNYSSVHGSGTGIDYNFDTNLWGWWKPKDVTTLTKDASERIAQIADLSGNDRHLVQTTDGSKPIWDGTGANCYGKDIRITESLGLPMSVYLVYTLVGYNAGYSIFGDANTQTYAIQFDGSPNHRLYVGGTIVGGQAELRNKLGIKQILTSICDTTLSESSVDGSIAHKAGNGGAAGINYFRLGNANIIVHECIVRSAHDTEETKIAIWNRLFDENGITLADEDLIVLAGQSNALGRSLVTEITDSAYKAELTDGYIYDHYSANHVVSNRYELINPGVNSASDVAGDFGFEQSLLYHLSDYLSKDVFITKYGGAGTSLAADAGNSDWNIATLGELYDGLKTNIIKALKMLMYERKRGRVKFLIWMQGEEDAKTEAEANAYAANLAAFIGAMKTYITTANQYYHREDDMNVVICKIHTSVEWGYAATVRAAQSAYVLSDADAIEIETESYDLMADNKHYTADSSIAIGIDIYNAIKDL